MFTTADLINMRAAQDGHMQDRCQILVYAAGTTDDYGEPSAPTYTAGSEIICGLDMRPGFEKYGQDVTSVNFDATLRLPIATALKETDRITITKRYGEDTTDLTFEISAPVQRGPSGIRVLLKKVTI
jgi:hypothetical protein